MDDKKLAEAFDVIAQRYLALLDANGGEETPTSRVLGEAVYALGAVVADTGIIPGHKIFGEYGLDLPANINEYIRTNRH